MVILPVFFSTQIKIDRKYLFIFRFLLINVYLEENYKIFNALSCKFLAIMPENVNSLKFNIFLILGAKNQTC